MLCSGFKLVIGGTQCHCHIHLRNLTQRINYIKFDFLQEQEQIFPSVSIQKKGIELSFVASGMEKGTSFSVFAHI